MFKPGWPGSNSRSRLRTSVAPDYSITEMIQRLQRGDRAAGDSLFTLCAARLRAMSRALMHQERTSGFHPSDLIQEVFAQKVGGGRLRKPVVNRDHFFSLMAAGMRQVLTDRARARNAQKRQVPAAESPDLSTNPHPQFLDVQVALAKLAQLDPDGRELIRLRYENGMTWEETAVATGRSVGQVRLECDYVLGWLRARLSQ